MRPEKERPGTPNNRGRAENTEAVNLRAKHSTHSLRLHPDRWAVVTRLAYRITRTRPTLKVAAVRCWAAATVALPGQGAQP
jgi:hypothetical protein